MGYMNIYSHVSHKNKLLITTRTVYDSRLTSEVDLAIQKYRFNHINKSRNVFIREHSTPRKHSGIHPKHIGSRLKQYAIERIAEQFLLINFTV